MSQQRKGSRPVWWVSKTPTPQINHARALSHLDMHQDNDPEKHAPALAAASHAPPHHPMPNAPSTHRDTIGAAGLRTCTQRAVRFEHQVSVSYVQAGLTSLNSFSKTLSFMVFFSLPLSAFAFLVLAFSISVFCRATLDLYTLTTPA